MKSVFIGGTDTGVGKTLVCAYLADYFKNSGYNAIIQKWVQTGASDLKPDIELATQLLNIPKDKLDEILRFIMPYSFSYPASPHLAAMLENQKVDHERIIHYLYHLEKHYDSVTIEGSGGLMVPLSQDYLYIDLIKKLTLPVLLVIGNKLGAINHSLLSIDALKRRKIQILGLIFNNLIKDQEKRILEDNVDIISQLSGVRVLGTIPYIDSDIYSDKSRNDMRRLFNPIGDRILNLISGL